MKENTRPVKRQVLSAQGWEFQVAKDRLPVQYAQTTVVGDGEGEEMGFGETGYNDRAWETMRISRESKTIREWNLIGPFPNADHTGFNEVYPPERDTNFESRYDGEGGQQLAWRRYESTTPETDAHKALALTDASAVVYALTYVWSPKAQNVQAVLAAENMKLFVNGKEIFKFHPMPRYYELRDAFAFKPTIELSAGWNSLLVKVEHDAGRFGRIVFSLRLSDAEGMPGPRTTVFEWPDPPERLRTEVAEATKLRERWYRLQIHPVPVRCGCLARPDAGQSI